MSLLKYFAIIPDLLAIAAAAQPGLGNFRQIWADLAAGNISKAIADLQTLQALVPAEQAAILKLIADLRG